MSRFRLIKNSFLGGQVSRDAVGRIDIPQYAHSCEILQNMIPILSGGTYRRPGTIFQDYIPGNFAVPDALGSATIYASSPPRVFPFIVKNGTSYAIVIGTQRWSELQGATWNPSGEPGGAYIQAYRASGNTSSSVVKGTLYTSLPYRCKSIKVAATATDQAVYTRQGGLGAVANSGVNTAVSPVTIVDVADSLQTLDDDIWSVQYCQSNDVMFLTHPDYQPQAIYLNGPDDVRAQAYDYALTGLALAQSRPYLNQNSTAVTLAPAWTSGQNIVGGVGTLTASASFFNALHGPRTGCTPEGEGSPITDGAIFALPIGEGNPMSGNNTDNGFIFCLVKSVTSATVAVVEFINGVPSNAASGTAQTSWYESAWSNYRGWPSACAIYEQRLCLASTIHQPSTMWFTATTAYGVTASQLAGSASCKFSALGDGPSQNIAAGSTGVLANGQNYSTPANWVYYPVDDTQGNGQSTAPLGSQPFRISLATTSLDAIQYLSPDQQLFIGTSTQEWVCAPQNGSFDVANSICTIQSHYGSDFVQAIRIGYELMFIHQKKDEMRAYQYNYFDQSFFGEPVQLFFDEYPLAESSGVSGPLSGRRKYRQIDWDSSRSTLWCTDTNGDLFGITRDRKLAITSWHTHQLGGFNAAHGMGQNTGDNLTSPNVYTDTANYFCDGSVVSVCSTPNPQSGIRDLWMVVKRSIGNNNIFSLERMVGANTTMQSAYSSIAPGNALEPVYVDCAYFLTDNGSPTDFDYTIGAQLVGQTLAGTYYSQAWGLFAIGTTAPVDSSGDIVLQNNLPPDYGVLADPHTIVVGLPYISTIQPVRIDPQSQVGTSQGSIKRPSKAYVRVFKTLMFKMGSPPKDGFPATLETVRFKPAGLMGQSPEIYTGDKEVFLPTNYDREGYVYILQDQPLPLTLVSLSIEGTQYEQ